MKSNARILITKGHLTDEAVYRAGTKQSVGRFVEDGIGDQRHPVKKAHLVSPEIFGITIRQREDDGVRKIGLIRCVGPSTPSTSHSGHQHCRQSAAFVPVGLW